MSRAIRTVALMTPGDMGHAVGALLCARGMRVITCLEGRSARSRALASKAGIEAVPDDAALVREADVLLSILVPSRALDLAERFADALRVTEADLLYVDCNAVAPETVQRIGSVIERAGGRFVDAGIIGPPPGRDCSATRFYVSGPSAGDLEALREFGLDVRVVSGRTGDASALKMCYAALNKGVIALMTEIGIAARRLGVDERLIEECAQSHPALLERMRRQVPGMVPKAYRWVGEMQEIARTFEACGLTPLTYEGAAEVYRLVAETPLARVSPEEWAEHGQDFDRVVEALVRASFVSD